MALPRLLCLDCISRSRGGVSAYGQDINGCLFEPGKTLVIRLVIEHAAAGSRSTATCSRNEGGTVPAGHPAHVELNRKGTRMQRL